MELYKNFQKNTYLCFWYTEELLPDIVEMYVQLWSRITKREKPIKLSTLSKSAEDYNEIPDPVGSGSDPDSDPEPDSGPDPGSDPGSDPVPDPVSEPGPVGSTLSPVWVATQEQLGPFSCSPAPPGNVPEPGPVGLDVPEGRVGLGGLAVGLGGLGVVDVAERSHLFKF